MGKGSEHKWCSTQNLRVLNNGGPFNSASLKIVRVAGDLGEGGRGRGRVIA